MLVFSSISSMHLCWIVVALLFARIWHVISYYNNVITIEFQPSKYGDFFSQRLAWAVFFILKLNHFINLYVCTFCCCCVIVSFIHSLFIVFSIWTVIFVRMNMKIKSSDRNKQKCSWINIFMIIYLNNRRAWTSWMYCKGNFIVLTS